MALKNKIFLAIAVSTLLGMASAKAYIVPGQGGGFQQGPRDNNGPRPLPPQQPMPPAPPQQGGGYPPYPGNGGGYGPGNGGYNGQEQRTIQVRRRIMNENLPLLQLAGIDRRYDGYIVQSVTAFISGSAPRAQVSLVINGQQDASSFANRGAITLVPRYAAVLGQVRDITLSVMGGVDLDTVVITLQARQDGGGDHGPGWGREITLPIPVARRMLGADRLDITQYINVNQYRGYRITAVEIEAASLYQVAFLDLYINGFTQGQSIQIGNFVQRYSVYPQDAVIGQSAASIVIGNRGDLDVRGVTLRLSRR
ncbi:MAG TPA: hypothetical protein VF412_10885 [Bdellovibrio sp.]|uniref:hypothetical protein n=1 Tax=Bdellovibrio sp. TaxID=28201 RepID=UPI002EF59CE9